MGRRQQQQGRGGGGGGGGHQYHANELFNFHFSTPANTHRENSFSNRSSGDYNSRNRRGNNNNNNNSSSSNHHHHHHGRNNRNKNNPRRSAQHRSSVRQTANSSMFHLHSSAEHTFLLTRRSPSKVHQNEYSFSGSDNNVSWESVRMVQQKVPLSDNNNNNNNNISNDDVAACPICLCDFVAARISKCGHSFCLPCILRHVRTYAASNPYHPVKCPCCGIPLAVEDMRPVVFEAVRPVVPRQSLRLRKLHRQKSSSSPFLPIPTAKMHSNPHFAPTFGIDADAGYSRFNYLDPDAYHATLVAHRGELEREAREMVGTGLGDGSTEKRYLSLAMGMVLAEQQKAVEELEEETALVARFASSNSGMYQAQSPALVFVEPQQQQAHDVADGSLGLDNLSLHETGESGLGSLQNDGVGVGVGACESTDSSSMIPGQRYRGDSICSYKSVDTASTPCSHHQQQQQENDNDKDKDDAPGSQKRSARKKQQQPRRKLRGGSMYLDTENAVHLYQAEDGQLVFLNGFNMTCLLSDFSKGPPSTESSSSSSSSSSLQDASHPPPLPDFIEGRVLEKENVHLTAETRKRMPFLNHIPLYTDIVFVELDLNHILSEATRRKFKNEMDKRRKKRHSRVQAEKRADRQARREDRERINERKARLQLVDPDDEFFHAVVVPPEAPEASATTTTSSNNNNSNSNNVADSAGFGPPPGGSEAEGIRDSGQPRPSSSLSSSLSSSSFSFSQAAMRGNAATLSAAEAFPELSSSQAFPTLGSSMAAAAAVAAAAPPASQGRPATATWGSGSSAKLQAASGTEPPIASSPPPGGGKKKKKKAQKLVLYSTGGSRGYY